MRIALVGTRGVPARYGGFETAVEEVGRRLVERGHDVTVYCRRSVHTERSYQGMQLVHLPAPRVRSAETLAHTALSSAHLLVRGKTDVAILFNAANAPLVPALHLRSIPVAMHVDGLEWKRGKWGRPGRSYYLAAERLAVASADALIADSRAIQAYYERRYGAHPRYLAYGAMGRGLPGTTGLDGLDLQPGRYHLVVARLEPENQVDVAIEAYEKSSTSWPLIVVGGAPYERAHQAHVRALAERNPGVVMLGGVWDQELLDELYANAASYVHGHTVGGTNPSLLRAAALGAPVLAADVVFNREVLAESARYYADREDLATLLAEVEKDPEAMREMGRQALARVRALYRWDDVAAGYERLCQDLVDRRRARR